MSRRGTGGNTEPLPFIRSFGANGTPTNAMSPMQENGGGSATGSSGDVGVSLLPPPPPPAYASSVGSDHRHDRERSVKSRDRDRDRERDRGDRDRSRDKSRDKDRDRDRDRDRRRRSRSRDRDRRRDRRDRDRDRDRRSPRRRSRSRSPRSPPRRTDVENVERNDRPIYSVEPPPPPPSNEPKEEFKLEPLPGPKLDVLQNRDKESASAAATSEAAREQRRKSRWSSSKAFIPGMVTVLPSGLDATQQRVYLLQMEVEDATRKLRNGEFVQPVGERSPSPEPIYDQNGKRLNTREVRKRQELEHKRHEKIQELIKINPEYQPPADYRPPNIRLHEKVWIPQDDYPEINFVGLLIGPRGTTLKQLELETGARIIIRGKGSVKEGKLMRRDGPIPGVNEPLHAYITGTDNETIKGAVERIQQIIEEALTRPDADNSLRRTQLRQLAVFNGTLRPEDILGGMRCGNCGSDQHKTYECTEAANVTQQIVCQACGGAGHIARDCVNPRTGYQASNNEELDNEYSALMAEISGNPKPQQTSSSGGPPEPVGPPQPLMPFKLPPQQPFALGGGGGGSHVPPPPPPSLFNLPPPPPQIAAQGGWDPAAAQAAAAAMYSAGFQPFSFLPPPPPPPPPSALSTDKTSPGEAF